MKLRTLALLSLALAIVGMVGLSAYGVITWRNIQSIFSEIDASESLHGRLHNVTAAIDYTTLVDLDTRVLAGMTREAEEIAHLARSVPNRHAHRAGIHLDEVAGMGGYMLDMLATGPDNGGISDGTRQTLSRQVRIQHAGASEALHTFLDERRLEVRALQQQALVSVAVATLAFALAMVLVIILIVRRIGPPLRQFDRALRAVAAGDMEVRVPVTGSDEFADLARKFNLMAEQREAHEQDLARSEHQRDERIKELRCLYQVLELTTSQGGMAAGEISARVVELLPAAMRWPELAVARVAVDGESVSSEGWRSPVLTMQSPILVEAHEAGCVEIGYRQEPERAPDEALFVDDERALADGVAMHIGQMLHNRRLGEMVSRSERLNAVGELTGGVAHDFNNLLTVILGNAELLSERLRDPGDSALAESIERTAQRGAELTGRLLAFARRQPLAPEPVDLNALISGMDEMLRRTLGEHITVELATSGDLWRANVDSGQLENALLNLVINARDAMPDGGRLVIETANHLLDNDYAEQREELAPGDYVMIAVSDTGAGIPADQLGRIFEPFYTTKEAGRGTGLGLSMVYGFVKQSGGHVEVYSEVGAGTTVRIYLPRTGDVAPVAATARPGSREDAPSTGHRILLVEDDTLVRRYAVERLSGLGYEVIAAENAPAALEVIRARDDIDLLFTDVVMPGGMSGRDLAETARELRPGLRVLYTSGYAESAIAHQGMFDGSVRLLRKPYRGVELAARVREALSGD